MNNARKGSTPDPHDVDEGSGHVRFDDRGNAVWETWRGRRLEHPGLAIADEEPVPNRSLEPNRKGPRIGYNPYESGLLKKKTAGPRPVGKKDLRALSKWIELKKKMEPEEP